MLYVLAATLGVNALGAQLGWVGRVSHGCVSKLGHTRSREAKHGRQPMP
jgi:hypothetical protein